MVHDMNEFVQSFGNRLIYSLRQYRMSDWPPIVKATYEFLKIEEPLFALKFEETISQLESNRLKIVEYGGKFYILSILGYFLYYYNTNEEAASVLEDIQKHFDVNKTEIENWKGRMSECLQG